MHRYRKNKKGSEINQVFNYIIALIVIGLIFMYGIKAVVYLLHVFPQVSELMLEKDVTRVIKQYSTEYGSETQPQVVGPTRVRYLCFTDYYSSSTSLVSCNSYEVNKLIQDSYSTSFDKRERKNVFMLDSKGLYSRGPFFAGNISLAPTSPKEGSCNYLCIAVENGYFHFKVTGLGDHVRVSEN
jgi:hypothetical protein